MVKVVDFKDSAIERIDKFRATPRSLPMLVHARYTLVPQDGIAGSQRVKGINYGLRIHKPHQMHSQHRETTASVLQWLVKKMDVSTRECVFVNPSRGIRRPPYVPEMARETGLCERTITRCLGSLTRSRYLFRTAKRFFLSKELFRDISLDITLERLSNQLAGLAKRNAREQSGAKKPFRNAKSNGAPQSPQSSSPESHKPFPKTDKPLPQTEANAVIGQSFLDQMKRAVGKRPPD